MASLDSTLRIDCSVEDLTTPEATLHTLLHLIIQAREVADESRIPDDPRCAYVRSPAAIAASHALPSFFMAAAKCCCTGLTQSSEPSPVADTKPIRRRMTYAEIEHERYRLDGPRWGKLPVAELSQTPADTLVRPETVSGVNNWVVIHHPSLPGLKHGEPIPDVDPDLSPRYAFKPKS